MTVPRRKRRDDQFEVDCCDAFNVFKKIPLELIETRKYLFHLCMQREPVSGISTCRVVNKTNAESEHRNSTEL